MSVNRYVNKIVRYGDNLIGHSARKAATKASIAADIHARGQTPALLKVIADRRAKESFNTRLKTGIIGTAAVGTGFLGVHKYHQHRDNAILKKIDSMYEDPYTPKTGK